MSRLITTIHWFGAKNIVFEAFELPTERMEIFMS